jgi:hypothetical protein
VTKIDQIISAIIKLEDLDENILDFEKVFTFEIRKKNPELFDETNVNQSFHLENTLNSIIKQYNYALEKNIDINDYFKSLESKMVLNGNEQSSVYSLIGSNLNKGIPPTIKEIDLASYDFEFSTKSKWEKEKNKP